LDTDPIVTSGITTPEFRPAGTVSRFLYPVKGDGHSSGPRISAQLKQPTRKSNGAGRSSSPIWSCSAWGLPCRRGLLRPRCALTAPFHPYPKLKQNPNPRRYFFCGTFRETRFERAPPAVSRHAALWRPDFPPGRQAETCLSKRPPVPAGPSSFSQNFADTVTVRSESIE
jgi:hypothetical protein